MGNAMSTNEAYVAASKGDAIWTRSIVRAMEPSRWSSKAVLGVQGTPNRLRPNSSAESDAHVEEFVDPHAGKDDVPDKDGGEKSNKFVSDDVKKLDKQLRITIKDLTDFGYSEQCPRCADLQAGIPNTWKKHSDYCRLRLYMCYK